MAHRKPQSIAEVISSGLCIGCGLCEAIGGARHRMRMTGAGSLRPENAKAIAPDAERRLLAACPGVLVEPRQEGAGTADPVWGEFRQMRYGWAGDAGVRFRAATGGVLTALGAHLVATRQVDFILQVQADRQAPMRSVWTLSDTPDAVIAAAGSRYGPAAPLAGLMAALERNRPFAIIAKPCDLSAVHNLAAHDDRVDRLCRFRLALVCGGQSRLKKSQDLLDELGVAESDLRLFRHRGHGNPGKTRIETRNGDAYERTYNELWADEAGWQLESRCKLCPDALGEAADIAAADVWPNGTPSGDDEGFNGIIVRSRAGEALVKGATDAGAIVVGADINVAQFNDFQPHQVRKKLAVKARLEGMRAAGSPVLQAPKLRLDTLGERLTAEEFARERDGTVRRVKDGRFHEDLE